jgi:hypothetical protein
VAIRGAHPLDAFYGNGVLMTTRGSMDKAVTPADQVKKKPKKRKKEKDEVRVAGRKVVPTTLRSYT